jgi:choline dehydrogenase-like flavoprotein
LFPLFEGPLGGTAPTGGLGFFSTSKVLASGLDWPNIQLGMAALGNSKIATKLHARTFNIKYDILKRFYEPLYGTDAFNIAILLTRPRSRGNIRLQSMNPKASPLIDPRSLEHPEDMDTILEGDKKAPINQNVSP